MAIKLTAKQKFIISTVKLTADYLEEYKKRDARGNALTWDNAVEHLRENAERLAGINY